jgi:cytochrome P450
MPFGAGSRTCVGKNFAILEALLSAAALLRPYRMSLESPRVVRVHPRITLAPERPIRVRLHARR